MCGRLAFTRDPCARNEVTNYHDYGQVALHLVRDAHGIVDVTALFKARADSRGHRRKTGLLVPQSMDCTAAHIQ